MRIETVVIVIVYLFKQLTSNLLLDEDWNAALNDYFVDKFFIQSYNWMWIETPLGKWLSLPLHLNKLDVDLNNDVVCTMKNIQFIWMRIEMPLKLAQYKCANLPIQFIIGWGLKPYRASIYRLNSAYIHLSGWLRIETSF